MFRSFFGRPPAGSGVPPAPRPPSNLVPPVISGDHASGSVLTCTPGVWSGAATISYAYQWRADGVDIPGATADFYTTEEEAGTSITCRVTATNDVGSESATSNAVILEEAPTPAESWFGSQSTTFTVSSNTEQDAAVFGRHRLDYNADLLSMFVFNEPRTTPSATTLKGYVYSDVDGLPGDLLVVTNTGPANEEGGYTELTFPPDTSLVPGNYWLGVGANNFPYRIQLVASEEGAPDAAYYRNTFTYSNPPADASAIVPTARYAGNTPALYVTFTTDDEEPDLEEPPSVTVAPFITGSNAEGSNLTVNTGSWAGVPTPTITQQWVRDSTDITGETSTVYTSLVTDVGSEIACRVTATNSKGSLSSTTAPRTIISPDDIELDIDLGYVVQSGAAWTAFINFVEAAVDGTPGYGFSPADAAYAYKITGDTRYRDTAVDYMDAYVAADEARIANNELPVVARNQYLYIGPELAPIGLVYEWCKDAITEQMKDRWFAYADQAIYNVWNPSTASWGGNPFPWPGWGTNDPGNNYYYSFCMATACWGLASDNTEVLAYLDDEKLTPLRAYMSNLIGGGSREGTGYGASHRDLFDLYQLWGDSGQSELALANDHLTETGRWWMHATMPTMDTYCPIGDLAREAYPNLFDYHRHLVLQARHQTDDVSLKDDLSWWLNNISVQLMSQGVERKYNLLPAGSNTSTPPTDLNYWGEGTGAVFARSSWEEDATFCHFLAGTYDQSHASQQQGAFVLFNDSFLTVSGNVWCSNGIYQQSDANNVLGFRTSEDSVIGQSYGNATSSVTLEEDGSFSATANLKPVVPNATVTAWNRVVDFDAPQHQLRVRDSYSTTSGTYAVFQVVVPSLPTAVGNVITCGDLRITVTTPGSPTVNFVPLSDLNNGTQSFSQGYRIDITGASGEFDVLLEVISKQGGG